MAAVLAAAIVFIPEVYGGNGIRVGATGGLTVSGVKNSRNVTGYNAGMTAYFPLGLGFAIQPSALYLTKGLSSDNGSESGGIISFPAVDMSVGYVEVPVQLQWGPDLLFFRPYIFAEPFVGCGINLRGNIGDNKYASTNFAVEDDAVKVSRWEYGLGLGGGLQVWHLQISAKYFWNFGQLLKADGKTLAGSVAQTVLDHVGGLSSFDGVMVQLSILF